MPLPQATKRLSRKLARDEAYERVRDWIIEGTLAPGEVLRDQDIARSLGVSRTPVREALRRLEDEGFVETSLNRWTRVAPLDLPRAIETYSVIEALEVFALERAQLTPQDLSDMRTANDAMRRSLRLRKAASALRADEEFHAILLQRAQNSELRELVAQLKTKLRRIELAYWGRASKTNQSVEEHAAILSALQKGAKRAAIAALQQNWEGARQRVRSVADSEGGAADGPPHQIKS
jgi:DNA-binding GntR family transcriptional regulator